VSGIVYVIKHGLQWRDVSKDYGPHKTLYNRFIRWSRLGVFPSGRKEPHCAALDTVADPPVFRFGLGAPQKGADASFVVWCYYGIYGRLSHVGQCDCCLGGCKQGRTHQTALQAQVIARLLASTGLIGLVPTIISAATPAAVRVVLATALLAFGNTAHATCYPNGTIDGANGAIVLGSAGCADASGKSATVVTGATVTSAGTGVTSPAATPGWALMNQGIITANGNAVTGGESFALTNSGTTTAGLSGALLGGGSTVINSVGGTISGGFTGLSISANGGSASGGPSTVDNAGTIASTSGFNDAILLGLGGAVTNRSTGIIRANGVGIAGASNPTIVNNYGQILEASTGIGLAAGGTVTNFEGAVISSTSRGVDIAGGVGAVTNSGSIIASFGRAVQLQAGGSVTNNSSGTITSAGGGTRAVYVFGGPSTIVNAGSINGGAVAAIEVESTQSSITNSGLIRTDSGAGIRLDATGASNTLTTIVNNAGGTIQGAVNALVANGNASVDFTNKGAVVGDLVFGAGNVALHFYTGSSLTGNLTAGTGTNTISFNGSGYGAFSNPITNFQTIAKQDDGTWTLSSLVSGATALNVTQGTLILSAANTYTGATSINGGALFVNGSIASSALTTVNGGGLIGGVGTLGNTQINAGGTFAPGPQNMPGSMTVAGNLTFQPSAFYFLQVNPTTASIANVTGTATLAGTVLATFARGRYIVNNYNILHADGGFAGSKFSGLVTANAPANFAANLSYTSTDVFLNLTANLGGDFPGGVNALPRNQRGVANVMNAWFNAGLPLPPNFVNQYGLTGTGLTNALASLAGEPVTGAQQTGYRSLGQFLYQMLDLQGPNRGHGQIGDTGGFIARYATDEPAMPKKIALSHANVLRAAQPNVLALYEPRWSIWASPFGGYGHLGGDPFGSGAHGLASSIVGVAAGLDHRIAPETVLGVSMSGGGTNWNLSEGVGGGRSDFFQIGVYGLTSVGAAYMSAAFAFANHWMSTQRAAAFGDVLTATFSAQNYGGRVESGYRIATALGGLTPYAAIQSQSFITPSYGETDNIPAGFGLNYRGRSSTDTRGELGGRFDHVIGTYRDALMMLRGRLAYAHDWVSNATLATAFSALPGAGFTVEGARPVKNTALLTTAAELRLPGGGAVLFAKFDGEFSKRSQMYYGSAGMRYSW
jgi:autotransporter-associated beta strand protein